MTKQQILAALKAAKEYFEEMGSFGGKFGSQQGFHVAEAHRLNGVIGKAISLVNQLSEPAGWQDICDAVERGNDEYWRPSREHDAALRKWKLSGFQGPKPEIKRSGNGSVIDCISRSVNQILGNLPPAPSPEQKGGE